MSAPMDVVSWAERSWIVPETRKLIVLGEWQKAFLLAAFPADGEPSRWETFLVSAPKKSGKTTLNAIATVFAAMTRPGPETVFCVANDLQQSQDRVFTRIGTQLRLSGAVKRGEASVGKSEITLRDSGTKIQALAADAPGAAGAIFGVSSWTEVWAYSNEGHVRLFEELTPIPGRHSLRFVDSYAGFVSDAPVLEPMWERALAGDVIHDTLPIYSNGRLWAFIAVGEEAQEACWLGDPSEMEGYYREQQGSMRPGSYARLHLNKWQQSSESFLTAQEWDRCTWPNLAPVYRPDADVEVHVGVDIGVKNDCSSVVCTAWDPTAAQGQRRLQVLDVKIWRNRPGDPLDLFETVVPHIRELLTRFTLKLVLFDPSQFFAAAQVLASSMPVTGVGKFSSSEDTGVEVSHCTMQELVQSLPNLTKATNSLWTLVKNCQLITFPEDELRQHILNAQAIESSQGLRLAKEKQSRKIDAAVALSFATLAAVTFPPDAGREPAFVKTDLPINPYDQFGPYG